MKTLLLILFSFLTTVCVAQSVHTGLSIGGNGVKVDSTYQNSWSIGGVIDVYGGNNEINWAVTAQLNYIQFYPTNGIETYKGLHYQAGVGIATPDEILKFQISAGYISNFNTQSANSTMTIGAITGIKLPITDNLNVFGSASLFRTTGYVTDVIKKTGAISGQIGVSYTIKHKNTTVKDDTKLNYR